MSGVGVLANASFVHRHRSLEETPQNLLSEDCFFLRKAFNSITLNYKKNMSGLRHRADFKPDTHLCQMDRRRQEALRSHPGGLRRHLGGTQEARVGTQQM